MDLSFRALLKFAERLHGHAVDAPDHRRALPYLMGSILTSWISLESFVNNMMQDYAALPSGTFSVHEEGFLKERQVHFNRDGANVGTFTVSANSEYRRIEDKVLFLIAKFGGAKIDKGGRLWQKFERVKKKRNALSHCRRDKGVDVDYRDSEEAMEVAREIIGLLSKRIWRKSVTW